MTNATSLENEALWSEVLNGLTPDSDESRRILGHHGVFAAGHPDHMTDYVLATRNLQLVQRAPQPPVASSRGPVILDNVPAPISLMQMSWTGLHSAVGTATDQFLTLARVHENATRDAARRAARSQIDAGISAVAAHVGAKRAMQSAQDTAGICTQAAQTASRHIDVIASAEKAVAIDASNAAISSQSAMRSASRAALAADRAVGSADGASSAHASAAAAAQTAEQASSSAAMSSKSAMGSARGARRSCDGSMISWEGAQHNSNRAGRAADRAQGSADSASAAHASAAESSQSAERASSNAWDAASLAQSAAARGAVSADRSQVHSGQSGRSADDARASALDASIAATTARAALGAARRTVDEASSAAVEAISAMVVSLESQLASPANANSTLADRVGRIATELGTEDERSAAHALLRANHTLHAQSVARERVLAAMPSHPEPADVVAAEASVTADLAIDIGELRSDVGAADAHSLEGVAGAVAAVRLHSQIQSAVSNFVEEFVIEPPDGGARESREGVASSHASNDDGASKRSRAAQPDHTDTSLGGGNEEEEAILMSECRNMYTTLSATRAWENGALFLPIALQKHEETHVTAMASVRYEHLPAMDGDVLHPVWRPIGYPTTRREGERFHKYPWMLSQSMRKAARSWRAPAGGGHRPGVRLVEAYDVVADRQDNARMPVSIGRIGDTLPKIPDGTAVPALPAGRDTNVWSYYSSYPAHMRVVKVRQRSVVTVATLVRSCDTPRAASEMFANRLEFCYKGSGGQRTRGARLVHAEFVSQQHMNKELALESGRTAQQKVWQEKLEFTFRDGATPPRPTGVYLHKKALASGGAEEYELQLVLVDRGLAGASKVRGVWNIKEAYATMDGRLASYKIIEGVGYPDNGYWEEPIAVPILTKYLERVVAPGTSLENAHTVPVDVVSSYSAAVEGQWSIFPTGDDTVSPRTTPGYWLDKNVGFSEMTELD